MAVDPKKTIQQHEDVPLSEILAKTAKVSPVISGLDMIGANTDVVYYTHLLAAGTLDAVALTLDGAIDVDATITISIEGVAPEPTAGVITFPAIGSAAGVTVTYTPTSGNEIATGARIGLTVGGGNTLATFADVTLLVSYTPVAS